MWPTRAEHFYRLAPKCFARLGCLQGAPEVHPAQLSTPSAGLSQRCKALLSLPTINVGGKEESLQRRHFPHIETFASLMKSPRCAVASLVVRRRVLGGLAAHRFGGQAPVC
eukprot:3054019-Alexandrium_andersonii.AAC.1